MQKLLMQSENKDLGGAQTRTQLYPNETPALLPAKHSNHYTAYGKSNMAALNPGNKSCSPLRMTGSTLQDWVLSSAKPQDTKIRKSGSLPYSIYMQKNSATGLISSSKQARRLSSLARGVWKQ